MNNTNMYCTKCGKCCCAVPIPIDTWIKHKDKVRGKYVIAQAIESGDIMPLDIASDKCVFLNDKNECLIYEDRPEICRAFGEDRCKELLLAIKQ